jgi:hypothetical protein
LTAPRVRIVTALWGRLELARWCMTRWIKWADRAGWDVEIFAAVSEAEAVDLCDELGVHHVWASNSPLGLKWNEAVRIAMEHAGDFDYLMNMGSDDILAPHLPDAYAPYIEAGTLMFGVPDMYAWDAKAGRGLYFAGYQPPYTPIAIGAGRMIHRAAVRRVWQHTGFLYQWDLTRGLDTASRNLLFHFGIAETILPPQRAVLDIKTQAGNINPITSFTTGVDGWLTWENIGKMMGESEPYCHNPSVIKV